MKIFDFFNNLIGNKTLSAGAYGNVSNAQYADLNALVDILNFNSGGAVTTIYKYDIGTTSYVPIHVIGGASQPSVGNKAITCTGCTKPMANNYSETTLWNDGGRSKPYCIACAQAYSKVRDAISAGYKFVFTNTQDQDPNSPFTDMIVEVLNVGPNIIASVVDSSNAAEKSYTISFYDVIGGGFVDAMPGTILRVTSFTGIGSPAVSEP